MNQAQLDRPCFRPLTSARSGCLPGVCGDERKSRLGLPVVEVALGLRHPPAGLIPQGRDGSVLIALGPAIAPPQDRAHETALLLFDARGKEWIEVRMRRELGGGEGDSTPRTAAVRRPALAADGELPWSFEVGADEEAHPAALDSTRRLAPGALEVDPHTGFFALTDMEGGRSNLHRLHAKRRRSAIERSLVLEILRAKRTADGALPRVRGGERLAAEWVPVASLESDERWLFVSIETPGISFALR